MRPRARRPPSRTGTAAVAPPEPAPPTSDLEIREASEKIEAFVRETSNPRAPVVADVCCYWSLFHLTETGAEVLRSKGLGDTPEVLASMSEATRADHAARIARLFVDAARENARDGRHRQRYRVSAYGSSARDAPVADSILCHLTPSEDDAAVAESSDDRGDPRLLYAQAVRLMDTMVREARQSMRDAREGMTRWHELQLDDRRIVLDVLNKVLLRNEALEVQLPNLMLELERARSEHWTRHTDASVRMLEANRHERWWLAGEKALPKLLDRLAAGPMSGFIRSLKRPQIEQLLALADSGALEPEQAAALRAALDTHLDLGLAERRARRLEESAAAGAATAAAPPRPGNGTLPGGGSPHG